MSLFKRTHKYGMVYSRAVSEMEQIQFTLNADDPSEFKGLIQAAADAVQVQADRFQDQLRQAEKDAAEARAARVEKGKAK